MAKITKPIKITETSSAEIAISRSYDGIAVHTFMKNVGQPEAILAERLMLEAIKVAFGPDGEDSSGRQKGRRISPEELVDYCLVASIEFHQQLQKRNLLVPFPSFEEQNKILDEAPESN